MTSISFSRGGIIHAFRGFDRAAQRGERVLDFMRDVGGEILDRADALREGRGEVARRRKIADLVAAVGDVGDRIDG